MSSNALPADAQNRQLTRLAGGFYAGRDPLGRPRAVPLEIVIPVS